jgi:hypothetical protein
MANHIDFYYWGDWVPPNTGATNSSGFSALPGGYYYEATNLDDIFLNFQDIGYTGHWWSSTKDISWGNNFIR